MRRITWFKYREVAGKIYAPYVTATLEFGGKKSRRIDFLIDSGASRSFVPRFHVADLFELHLAPAEIESEMRDVGGRPVKAWTSISMSRSSALAGSRSRTSAFSWGVTSKCLSSG